MKIALQSFLYSQILDSGLTNPELAVSCLKEFRLQHFDSFLPVHLDCRSFEDWLINWSAALHKENITMPTAYIGCRFHEKQVSLSLQNWKSKLALIRNCFPELKQISCNPDPVSWFEMTAKTDEELEIQVLEIKLFAELLRQFDMRFCYHFHKPELMNNAREIRHVLSSTDDRLVEICFDINWCTMGGWNAADFFKEYSSRISILHLRSSRSSIWLEHLDESDEDYRSVLSGIWNSGFDGMHVIELGNTENQLYSLTYSKRHSKSLEKLYVWRSEYDKLKIKS